MTEAAGLVERREKLKRQLQAGEYRTLIDMLLDGVARTIRKFTRKPRPISPWITSFLIYLIIVLIPTVLIQTDEPNLSAGPTAIPFEGLFLFRLLIGYSNIAIMVAANIYLHRVFTIFHENVLDTIESNTTLDEFEGWLRSICAQSTHLIVSLLGGVLVGGYLIFLLYAAGILIPLGTVIATLLFSVIFSAFMYLLAYMIVFSAQLGGYHLKLYVANPGNSEVINSMKSVLGNFLYLVAIYVSFVTLFVVLAGFLSQTDWFVLLLFWMPIIAIFILNQRSLSNIIKRAKWKTLSEIQAKVEQLHASEKLSEKENMESINRLMDYHDRILKSRNAMFNTETILSLINSLILPLLALLLGNLDKLFALLR